MQQYNLNQNVLVTSTFVASSQHVKNKCYHEQHANSIDNHYERWVKGFYGLASKYLENYLNWFVFLERVK